MSLFKDGWTIDCLVIETLSCIAIIVIAVLAVLTYIQKHSAVKAEINKVTKPSPLEKAITKTSAKVETLSAHITKYKYDMKAMKKLNDAQHLLDKLTAKKAKVAKSAK